jgi:HEAT repeat protein
LTNQNNDEVGELIQLLQQSDDIEQRSKARETLANLGVVAVPALIQAVTNENNDKLALSAVNVLMMMGDPCIEPLIQALKDPQLSNRTMLVTIL